MLDGLPADIAAADDDAPPQHNSSPGIASPADCGQRTKQHPGDEPSWTVPLALPSAFCRSVVMSWTREQ